LILSTQTWRGRDAAAIWTRRILISLPLANSFAQTSQIAFGWSPATRQILLISRGIMHLRIVWILIQSGDYLSELSSQSFVLFTQPRHLRVRCSELHAITDQL
jgi:hypothetical protein